MSHLSELQTFDYSYCSRSMAQSWVDLFLWEKLLNKASYIDGIVELGTGNGGFSLFLKHQADQRNISFYTFDNNTWVGFQGNIPDRSYLAGHFIKANIVKEAFKVEEVLDRFKYPLLFCDNGDKPFEVAFFSEYLPKDSIVVVHDWNMEIRSGDIPAYLEDYFDDNFYSNLGSKSRVFLKC